jgi:hypothetical protein
MVKLLITFACLIICCFFISPQNISSQNISSQGQNVSFNISPQDMIYVYKEPIEGLKFYNSMVTTYGTYLMLWMTFDSKEDKSCIAPYFHLQLIDKLGAIKYIDLNYTFPAEAVCPIRMKVIHLAYNYILITYIKTDNGIDNKYGLIINYSSKIIR